MIGEKYPKIYTLFERNEKKKVIVGNWSLPEFEYLKDCLWHYDEKIDGMNLRIEWLHPQWTIDGRNDNSSLPAYLVNYLMGKLERNRRAWEEFEAVTLYGEGFGFGIQGKMGISYAKESLPSKDSCGFRLFDIKIGEWWLERDNTDDVAEKLRFDTVPSLGSGTIDEAIKMCQAGFTSQLGDVIAEGLILRPPVDLFTRKGERIIAKLKYRDFI